MTIAKIAYLTSPSAGRYVFNFQAFGSDDLISIEIGPDHMRNILIDGTTIALRDGSRPLANANAKPANEASNVERAD